MIDVAALAAVQMRTARAAYAARLAWQRAREEWLHADADFDYVEARIRLDRLSMYLGNTRRALAEADRAYQAACGELLAETLERSAPAEQPGLF